MWPFDIFKKKLHHDPSFRENLIRKTLRKLGKLNLRKKSSTIELYELIREFFKEYFHVKYEFTYEELQHDIRKIRIDNNVKSLLVGHLEHLKEKRFGQDKLSVKELQEIEVEFREVLHELQRGV